VYTFEHNIEMIEQLINEIEKIIPNEKEAREYVALWVSEDLSDEERDKYFKDIMEEMNYENNNSTITSINRVKSNYFELYKLNSEFLEELKSVAIKNSNSNTTAKPTSNNITNTSTNKQETSSNSSNGGCGVILIFAVIGAIIIRIFKEFKIPVEMIYKIPLTDSLEVRNIIKSFEENEEENIKTASAWLNILEEKFLGYHEIIKPVFLNGLSSDLSFEDKVLLKGYEGLKRLLKNLRNNFEICDMLENKMESSIFVDYLKDCALNSTLTIENMNRDGVKILNTDLAKGVFYKHLYILGLNEGEVPGVTRNTGLFTDMEVNKLYTQGINYRNYKGEDKIQSHLSSCKRDHNTFL
jgi:hypothetical protein